MSGVFGLNFTHSGNPHAAEAETAWAVASAEWANMRPRSSTFGQLTLTSTAMTPGAPASIEAAWAYSCALLPQMLATTRAPRSLRSGSSCATHAATPGPWSPTELSMPAGVSCTRGARLPGQGCADSDFTTTAPRVERSM